MLPNSGPIGLTHSGHGRLLMAVHNAGLMRLVGDEVKPYPIRISDSNRLLRDRDGSLWIGTIERGLIHVHNGRTDTFTQSDGLSGDIILSLFEDREGSVWVSTTGGLDRFRELPVNTLTVRQGLSSDATSAVLAASDGSVWIGTHDGLTRWKNGKVKAYRRASGMPDDSVQSLFQDHTGRIWVFTDGGLGYLRHGRYIAVPGVPGGEVNSITGDDAAICGFRGNRVSCTCGMAGWSSGSPGPPLDVTRMPQCCFPTRRKEGCGWEFGKAEECRISKMAGCARPMGQPTG